MTANRTGNEKVVLVTGSAQRVGAAIIKNLHARGWRVIIHYRHSEQAAFKLADSLVASAFFRYTTWMLPAEPLLPVASG